MAKKRLVPIPCAYCNKEFNPICSTQRYCSVGCSDKARRRPVELICDICGKLYEPVRNKKTSRYCSLKCAGRAKKMLSPIPKDINKAGAAALLEAAIEDLLSRN